METFEANNIHGRNSYTLGHKTVSPTRVKLIKDSKKLAPLQPNAYTCPFTYYHILDAILSIQPGYIFRTDELREYLADRPLRWDTVTVGRVLADIAESLELANGRPAIGSKRYWDGRRYWMTPDEESRAAMENLLDDLRELTALPRTQQSPLRRCSSLGPSTNG